MVSLKLTFTWISFYITIRTLLSPSGKQRHGTWPRWLHHWYM